MLACPARAKLDGSRAVLQVTDVWVAGRRIVSGRKVLTLDETDLLKRAHAWGDKIRESKLCCGSSTK